MPCCIGVECGPQLICGPTVEDEAEDTATGELPTYEFRINTVRLLIELGVHAEAISVWIFM